MPSNNPAELPEGASGPNAPSHQPGHTHHALSATVQELINEVMRLRDRVHALESEVLSLRLNPTPVRPPGFAELVAAPAPVLAPQPPPQRVG